MADHAEGPARSDRWVAETKEPQGRVASLGESGHLGALVSTNWVWLNHRAPGVRVIEVGYDTSSYDVSHIPGSVGLAWSTQVGAPRIEAIELESLMSRLGVQTSDTIVLYGDALNIFALHMFWLLTYYGHADVRIMDGGRNKWLGEQEKPMTADRPQPAPRSHYLTRPAAAHLAASAPTLPNSRLVRVLLGTHATTPAPDVAPADVILHLIDLLRQEDGTFLPTPLLQAAFAQHATAGLVFTAPSPPAAAAAWFAATYLCRLDRCALWVDR